MHYHLQSNRKKHFHPHVHNSFTNISSPFLGRYLPIRNNLLENSKWHQLFPLLFVQLSILHSQNIIQVKRNCIQIPITWKERHLMYYKFEWMSYIGPLDTEHAKLNFWKWPPPPVHHYIGKILVKFFVYINLLSARRIGRIRKWLCKKPY